jgi:hypothetical protein
MNPTPFLMLLTLLLAATGCQTKTATQETL